MNNINYKIVGVSWIDGEFMLENKLKEFFKCLENVIGDSYTTPACRTAVCFRCLPELKIELDSEMNKKIYTLRCKFEIIEKKIIENNELWRLN